MSNLDWIIWCVPFLPSLPTVWVLCCMKEDFHSPLPAPNLFIPSIKRKNTKQMTNIYIWLSLVDLHARSFKSVQIKWNKETIVLLQKYQNQILPIHPDSCCSFPVPLRTWINNSCMVSWTVQVIEVISCHIPWTLFFPLIHYNETLSFQVDVSTTYPFSNTHSVLVSAYCRTFKMVYIIWSSA